MVVEEQVDDHDADNRRHHPRDLQRELERVVDDPLAERRGARPVGLGSGDLGAVGGEEHDARDGRPHGDHVAGADAERQPERHHRPGRGRLARRQRRDPEDGDGDHERPALGQVAEGLDDRVLVVRDERVGHPGDAEQGDHRDHAGLEDLRRGDRRRLHLAEQDDQRGRGQHQHLDQRGHGHRLDPALLDVDRRAQALEDAEHADQEDGAEEDGDAALGVRQQHDVGGWRGRLDLTRVETAQVLGVVLEVLAVPVDEERHHEDADDAGRHGDQQDVHDVEAVDLDQRQHRRHRGRHRACRDAERRRDRGARERALGPDLVGVGELVDHRDQREERVAGTGEDREQVRDVRRHEVEGLRSRPQRLRGDEHHVVDAPGGLHGRRRRDHGDDDQHRAGRRLARVEPEDEDQDQRADAAPQAESDPARADAQEDERDDDRAFEGDQKPVGRAHRPVSSCSSRHVLEAATAAASWGSDAAASSSVWRPLPMTEAR